MITSTKVRTLPLPTGRDIPVLGQGTWHMGENPALRPAEIAALRYGLDLGMTLIDTAEMYGDGEAERIVGEAISRRREEVFLVSKILPQNATRIGTPAACHRSLRRLGTDYLDLYLLHWRGEVPVAETLAAFQSLKAEGWILDYGVSNFDLVPDEAAAIAVANDTKYGLGGSVYSRDEVHAHVVAGQIDAGMVYINHPAWIYEDMPFGGTKKSGYGRECGPLGIQEFVNKKLLRPIH